MITKETSAKVAALAANVNEINTYPVKKLLKLLARTRELWYETKDQRLKSQLDLIYCTAQHAHFKLTRLSNTSPE